MVQCRRRVWIVRLVVAMTTSIRDLMASGRHDEAIAGLKTLLAQKRLPHLLVSLGIAHLWKGDYASAGTHFDDLIAEKPKWTATYYALSGAAKWCMEAPHHAIMTWRSGYKCAYGDGAGNMTIPLMLYFAAVRTNGLISLEEAEELLKSRLKHSFSKNWPGPLARYVLGEIPDADLEFREVDDSEDAVQIRRRVAYFFRGVVALRSGNREGYREHMCAAGAPIDPNNARNAMFYVARYECATDEP